MQPLLYPYLHVLLRLAEDFVEEVAAHNNQQHDFRDNTISAGKL